MTHDSSECRRRLAVRVPDATERILHSAATRLALSGASVLTMQEVADDAGVSKALIHYHFHDKDTLLTRLVTWMAEGLVRRERAALARSTPQSAIDDLWRWLEAELARGHIRALVELAGWQDRGVRAAASEAMRRRREAATSSAERLFSLLALRSRIPVGFAWRSASSRSSMAQPQLRREGVRPRRASRSTCSGSLCWDWPSSSRAGFTESA